MRSAFLKLCDVVKGYQEELKKRVRLAEKAIKDDREISNRIGRG